MLAVGRQPVSERNGVTMTGIRRRDLLAGVAGAATIAGTGIGTAVPAQAAPPVSDGGATSGGEGRTVRLREGTDLAAQLSPDGRMIAIDVVGVLWTLPACG